MDKYKKYILILIGLSSLIKLAISDSIGFGNDEVYYWTYALNLQWNYFDHPPIVAWLIRLTTCNLLLHSELFVRLGATIASAASTWIIYQIGCIIKDERTGWIAALLFTASIYSSIISGLFILPDSPQAFFWFWSVLLLVKINKAAHPQKGWILFGVVAGLCIMCKIHGVFLWLGVGLYALLFNRSWLKNPWMYMGGIISLIIISPIIIWNFQNHFITYTFHSSRVAVNTFSIHYLGLLREISGQIFYSNPVNFFLIWVSIRAVNKAKFNLWRTHIRLLLCCFLPLIFTLLLMATFSKTLPHWSGPSYSGLIILAALYVSSFEIKKKPLIPAIAKISLALLFFIALLTVTAINFYPGSLSSNKKYAGDGDPTVDMYGWKEMGSRIDSLYRSDIRLHKMPVDSRIIVTKWFPGAHIDFYVTQQTGLETYAIGRIFDLHQYLWSNKTKKQMRSGECDYYIQTSNAYQDEYPGTLQKYYEQIDKPVILKQYRNGKYCRQFYVFRLKKFRPTNNMFDSWGALKDN